MEELDVIDRLQRHDALWALGQLKRGRLVTAEGPYSTFPHCWVWAMSETGRFFMAWAADGLWSVSDNTEASWSAYSLHDYRVVTAAEVEEYRGLTYAMGG